MKNNSKTLKGIAAAPGFAIAKAYLFAKEKEDVSCASIENVDEAIHNLNEAIEKSKKELNKIFSLAIDKLGDKRAAIFEAQIMILDDPILIGNIHQRIKEEKKHPEFIVHDEITKYQNMMNASTEAYMKERSQDIEDIKLRIIRNLKKKKWRSKITSEVIVVTTTLTPADTVLFAKESVKGYITDFGGLTSHAAIVARSLDIPAVVGVKDSTNNIQNGDTIIVDGFNGVVIVNPDESQIENYQNKIIQLAEYDEQLAELRDVDAVTSDGRRINLMANLDITDEIETIIQNGAEGIGLVRTEQLFHENDQFPDEESQYIFYKELAERLYPRKVTIRAFDVGGDKVLPFDVKEPNPFLGWRGIRFLLDNTQLFKMQIRAVLRANIHKNINFMIPMVSDITEIDKTKKIIAECNDELDKEGIQFDRYLKLGIMVEVPSVAVMSAEFSDCVDFVSIGTNDLIQYLLAVDRGNEIVSAQYQEFHPAVVRTIHHIIQNTNCDDDDISMCGEMAADIVAIPLLVGLGLKSLSVSASAIPNIKKIIKSLNYSEAKKVAEQCLKLKTADEVCAVMHKYSHEKLTDQLQNII
ncbi:MAG: phosphoenolpyruvate--protein phosphotransferase [Ignavibacteriae bacterium]|nr:phosphoenolpyruvate--protein phosphotransferase [Ignavibacteriota bacterium]NOG98328.1 phosphoenolpyruvate--protein phosphotransferase [Ignavibacteriota bacterium]